MEKLDCRACLEEELIEICLENNIKKFRANQIFKWVQQKGAHDWEEMKNIGKEDREKLREILYLQPLEIIREQRSKDGTRKFLFRLVDEESIETVLMDYDKTLSRDRQTICLSTQVGCPVGCSFCATGMAGFQRNLTVGEITGQVLEVMRYLQKEDPEFKVTNIVFMGMGEPFLNYEAVLKTIEILNSENGQKIGMRRMTISTSGVVPKIVQLAKDNSQVGLAISLHSAKDEVRDNLVPMNKKYPLAKLIRACRNYQSITNRRITFEVALNNQNTSREEAKEFVKLLKGMTVHVNLIPVNPVQGSRVKRPSNKEISVLKEILEAGRIPVSIREEKGVDIEAACGQLRQRLECEVYEPINQN
jgi:23S rRNA (adenine2503-C2)-methyltransferase